MVNNTVYLGYITNRNAFHHFNSDLTPFYSASGLLNLFVSLSKALTFETPDIDYPQFLFYSSLFCALSVNLDHAANCLEIDSINSAADAYCFILI